MGQEDIAAQSEEMLNKLTRSELVALNNAIIRRIKVMDDFEGTWRVSATLLTKLP
jgi:hypothetical protein